MDINELFEKIQDNFLSEKINGEFVLQGNCIIWEYHYEDGINNIEESINDNDEFEFNFDIKSTEEILHDAYDEDLIQIEEFFDKLDEYNNWSFSEPEIIENIITFKIF